MLLTAARRLVGRRITVPCSGDELDLRVESLQIRPNPVGLAIGQLDDVRLVATDVRWRGTESHRLVLACRNVQLRPFPPMAAVAAQVTVEIALRPAAVRSRLTAAWPAVRFEISDDDEARLLWSRRPSWGSLAVAPELNGAAMHLRPRALRAGRRRVALPGWLPTLRIALPPLPRGLRLREIEIGAEEILLRMVADEWREQLPLQRLVDVLTRFA
jgi:hypothetical protein